MLSLFFLIGCGSTPEDTVSSTVEKYCSLLRDGKHHEAKNLTSNQNYNKLADSNSSTDRQTINWIHENLTCTVKKVKIKKDTAKVTIKISNRDINSEMSNLVKISTSGASTAELEKKYNSLFDKKDFKKFSNEFELSLLKKGDDWKIDLTGKNWKKFTSAMMNAPYLDFNLK